MAWGVVRFASVIAALLSGASAVLACPVCESEAGERVRAGIFDADFGHHVAATFSPFLVFVAIIGLIHFGTPWSRSAPRKVRVRWRGMVKTTGGHAAKDQTWTTG